MWLLGEADVVFTGKVVAVHEDGAYAELQVYRVWKGAPYATRFLGRGEGDMCSEWWGFDEGEEYLIYASNGDAGVLPTTSACEVVELFHVVDGLHVLGPGQAPEPGTEAPGPREVSPLSVGDTGTGTVRRHCEANHLTAAFVAMLATSLAGAGLVAIRRRARQT